MVRLRGVRITLDAVGSILSLSSSGIRYSFLRFQPHKTIFSQPVNEGGDLFEGGIRNVFKAVSDLRHDIREASLAVHPFPYRYTDRIGSHGIGRIGIEQYSPVVELLPEHNDGIGNRSIRLIHGSFPILH